MQIHKPIYKHIRSVGLIIFLAGFALFLGLFFMPRYKLTPESLQAAMGYPEEPAPNAAAQTLPDDVVPVMNPPRLYQIVLEEARFMLGETYYLNPVFISELQEVFDRSNEQAKQVYGISSQDLERIAKAIKEENNLEYDTSLAARQLTGKESFLEEKQELLQKFTAELQGRQFKNTKELTTGLNNALAGLPEEIVREKGLDPYGQGSLKTSLAKHSVHGLLAQHTLLFFLLAFGLPVLGALMYILPAVETEPGIKNNGIFKSSLKNRGWIGILLGTFLILFYIFLYFFPYYMVSWILLTDPLSYWLKGSEASEFFMYGFLYTLAILVMGIRMIIKYRHSRYHIVRTLSLMFFQLAFAFIIPEVLVALQQPYMDFKNIWPLNYDFFFDYRLEEFLSSGKTGIFMLLWGIALIIIAVPVFSYFYGKRWYCSWVCGCGALAENLGDPFRQLSDKSVKAWNIERWMVHSVLVFAVVMTIVVLFAFFTGSSNVFGIDSYTLRYVYGFGIGSIFAGVVGTGFYPLMGNRVWCRFGCPLAAYIGLVQRFRSRFRITTNGGQCISCGNCSTYCEMGIDVRWYAQRGQNVVRASCVGCGICSSVCPRGVLKLENKDPKGRFGLPTNEIL